MSEKEERSQELLEKVTEEVHMLYSLEKDVAALKESAASVCALKEELKAHNEERERVKKALIKARKIAISVLLAAIIGALAFTLISCDCIYSEISSLYGEIEEAMNIAGTSWIRFSSDAPYVTLEFSEDGNTCIAYDSSRWPTEGSVIFDRIIFDGAIYTFSRLGSTLTLEKDNAAYSYTLNSD